MNRQTALFRGAFVAAAWLAWLVGGYTFVAGQGPLREVLQGLSREQPLVFYGWVLVSTALLFWAILLGLRGLSRRTAER